MLNLLFSFLIIQAQPSDRDLISLEGIYKIETRYVTASVEQPSTLDRLVLIRPEAGLNYIAALSHSTGLGPGIFMRSVTVRSSSTPRVLRLTAEGGSGSGIYGELKIKINIETGDFHGYFSDAENGCGNCRLNVIVRFLGMQVVF